jgi:hypothetical protein
MVIIMNLKKILHADSMILSIIQPKIKQCMIDVQQDSELLMHDSVNVYILQSQVPPSPYQSSARIQDYSLFCTFNTPQ